MTEENAPLRLLTVNEACAILGTNKYEVYRLIHSGALHAMKNRPGGGRYRIPREAVDDYRANAYNVPANPARDSSLRSVADVAAQLNCSQETVRRLVACGDLEATRFAGRTSRLRISTAAVDAYLDRHRASPPRADEKTA